MNILDLLKEDNFKPVKVANTKGGEYACSCPWCGGDDRFRIWPKQGSGRFWCRQCKKSGDRITYLMDYRKESYPNACALLGIKPKPKTYSILSKPKAPNGSFTPWKPYPIKYPSRDWQTQARFFVFQVRDKLLKSPEILSYLNSRGLKLDTIKRAFLGFNPEDRFEDRTKWGLPEEMNVQGNPKKLWIPRGIVIPCYRNEQLVRVRVRRMNEDVERDRQRNSYREPIRYYNLPGGDAHACMVQNQSPFYIVVESDLDAILLDQEAGDLISALALGSAQNRPDEETCRALNDAKVILLSLDADSAGAKEAWTWWQNQFPNMIRWAPVNGKDPGEMHENGESLKNWIAAGLNKAGYLVQALALRKQGADEPQVISVPADMALEDLLDRLKDKKRIAVNLVTSGDDPFTHHILKVYLAADDCPILCVDLSKLPDSELDPLRQFFESGVPKIFFNAKPQLQFLWRSGFKVNGGIVDLMLAEQIVTAGLQEQPLTLEGLVDKYLGHESTDDASRPLAILQMLPFLGTNITKLKLQNVASLEFRCIQPTALMELNGMKVDVDGWQIASQSFREELAQNPDNNSLKHKIGFMDNLCNALHPVTGRIHAQYSQIGAPTGRFSCSNPNMQGIPKDKVIRDCFVAEAGHCLIRADYSQIELRILAEISGDQRMIQAFKDGQDLHKLTASEVSGIAFDEVSDELRKAAKAINFGVIYGMGAEGLVTYAWKNFGVQMTIEQAKDYMDGLFLAYPGVKKWRDQTIQNTHAKETCTLLGRKRFWSDDPKVTELLNSPIQGTAADIMKIAMKRVSECITEYPAKVVACIHDELVIESPIEKAEIVARVVQYEMEESGRQVLKSVPVVVDIER
jgi:DNA polymerase I-like protein with 3'-5' exonuclease and polymerase domains